MLSDIIYSRAPNAFLVSSPGAFDSNQMAVTQRCRVVENGIDVQFASVPAKIPNVVDIGAYAWLLLKILRPCFMPLQLSNRR